MPRKRPRLNHSSRLLTPTRRRFLQGSAAAVAGIALSNCRQNLADVSSSASSASTPTSSGGSAENTLHIYTWADYRDEELVAQFTEATGIRVVVDLYDSNETMLAKLQAGSGSAYSILYPSDYMVTQMVEADLLTPLDLSRIQGLDQMLDQWRNPAYDPGNAHSIPFSWGTTGLLYNRELVSTPPEDWSYLWDNQTALSRRLTLLEDVRETLGAVLKSLGYSYNATDPAQLEAAFNRLMALKPDLAAFKSFGFEEELLGGDLMVVMSYSVDAIAATLEDDRMAYVIPASGSSVWTDTMVIPKGAPTANAAYQWINFVLQPEVSKDTVERLYCATPNANAYERLSAELKANKNLFPPADLLAKCEGIAPVGDAITLYDRYWTQVTSS